MIGLRGNNGIVLKGEVTYREYTQHGSGEDAEDIVLYQDVAVVSAAVPQAFLNTGTCFDASSAPYTEVAIVEYVTAYRQMAHSGLLKPETGVAFHQYGGSRHMERVVFNDGFSSGT